MATNDETPASFTESDLVSLGEKLASLDLTEPERAALGALISDDDVGGFGRYGGRFDILGGIRKGMGVRVPGLNAGVRAKRASGIRADWTDALGIAKPGRI